MCPSNVEYEDDENDNKNYFVEAFNENWNETLHHYKNMTLHNIMIYTDTIHVNFYIIISLLAILLVIYILKHASQTPTDKCEPFFSTIRQRNRRSNNEHVSANFQEQQELRQIS